MNFKYYALFALAFFSINNFAQDVEEVVEENTDENIEEVVTTGSRIARDPLESAQPITILDGDMIRNMGLTAASALTDLPEVDSVASISGEQSNLGAGQAVASNFGLNSSRTVTLVNGRRYVGSQGISAGGGSGGAVNLANVPTALIDRVEIVPVGGAAIYGADAIAGVVNYVLKDDFEGAEIMVDRYDFHGLEDDFGFDLTIGGNFADGKGNIILNAAVENRDAVFESQAGNRLKNCLDGRFYKLASDTGQQQFFGYGDFYPQEVEATRGAEYQNEDGWLPLGIDGQGCATLTSNPVEGLVTAYGDNEVGAVGASWNGNLNASGSAPEWYRFGAPGQLVSFFPGTPTESNGNYYTVGADIRSIFPDNTLRAAYEKKNISIFVNYDINENTQLFFDIYQNNYYAQDPGQYNGAHYSDYWFGTADTDNCTVDGDAAAWYIKDTNCWTSSSSIPVFTDDPFLTPESVAILEANGFGPKYNADGELCDGKPCGTAAQMQKLWKDLSPNTRGDQFENRAKTQFYTMGLTGNFDMFNNNYNYEIGYSEGETRVEQEAPAIIAARFMAAIDYKINPDTGEIDCRYNFDNSVDLPYYGVPGADYSNLGGGVGLGPIGSCVPFNPWGYNLPQNRDALDYMTSYGKEGATISQESHFASLSGSLADLPAGPLEFAVGWDNRKESARYEADQLTKFYVGLRGSAVLDGYGEYEIESTYAEISVPVVSGMPYVEDLRFDYGYREIENTNSVGSRTYDVSALSLYWRVNDQIALRASDQTTTKAPTIDQLFEPLNPSFSQADDPCDARYISDGDFPDNRAANCAAAGITQPFDSFVAGGTVQGKSGGNRFLRDENADTFSVGLVYTPDFDFMDKIGNVSLTADYIEINLRDYVTTFSLEDFMVACYDAASYPNDFCNNFERSADGNVVDFEVGPGNAGIIDFATMIYKLNWSNVYDFGQLSLNWRAMQQKERLEADSGDPEDLVDTTGDASNPEWTQDLTIGLANGNHYAYYKMDFVAGGYINKNETDTRPDKYLDRNGNVITEYDGYWFDTIGYVYQPTDNLQLILKVNNPWDHDGSESRYQEERAVQILGRSVTTTLYYKF